MLIRRTIRAHVPFGSVLLIAVIVRVLAMLAYPPALWTSDSLRYLSLATRLTPYPVQPVGYPALLWLLKPFHSLLLVSALQHAMGLVIGVAVYAVLRRRFALPGWAATLAAVPPVLSARAIEIEHFLLSDTFFGLLVTAAIVIMLWSPLPRMRSCVVAGLLLGAGALVRSQGMMLFLPFGFYLAARLASPDALAGLRRRLAVRRVIASLLAMGAALAVPLVAYASWYDSANGTFQLTSSTGAFLYSRVTTFADCSVIKPPDNERWLCLSVPSSKRQHPAYYLWHAGSPLRNTRDSEFGEPVDHLATDFALRAIEAQPMAYLGSVWQSTIESFKAHTDQPQWYLFPAIRPQSVDSLAASTSYTATSVHHYDRRDPDTQVEQPTADLIQAYQRVIFLPGPLLAIIVLAGLAGIAATWRRFGGPAALPWLTGAVLIVTPAATADFSARYLVASVPAFCIAAAISLQTLIAMRTSAAHDRSTRPTRNRAPALTD